MDILAYADATSQAHYVDYEALLLGMTGLVSSAILSPDATSERTMQVLRERLYSLVTNFRMSHDLASSVAAMGKEGQADLYADTLHVESMHAIVDESLRLHLTEIAANVNNAIATLLSADMGTALDSFRKFRFEADINSNNMGHTSGMQLARARYLPVNARFVRQDRAGKRWSSGIYLRTSVRSALVTAYNDSYLHTLSRDGVDTAKVAYRDSENAYHGLKFSISGNALDMPSYDSLRTIIFHPNADAVVRA